MESKIKVHTPYFKGNDDIRVKIENTSINAHSEIKIKFLELIELATVTSKTAIDFFFISSFVYGIDRFIERNKYSTDGWSRELNVCFPVYSVEVWENVKSELEKTLSFLTGDYWTVYFCENTLTIPSVSLCDVISQNDFEQINLFSGGLDSLIGAIDFLADSKNENKNLLLVSHTDTRMKGKKEQEMLYESLFKTYGKRVIKLNAAEIALDSTSQPEMEKTFRSRSLLFLGIAVLVADYKKLPIIVPENGSISLNYPLSASRRGSCSTRTTHPTFILYIKLLLSKLSLTSEVENPYEFDTKGEMVIKCKNIELLKLIVHISNSCGKRGHTVNRNNKDSTHCGVCMPCTYRKASLMSISDQTTYGDDLNKKVVGFKNTPFFLSKQGQDLNACFDFLGKNLTNDEIRQELIISGVKDYSKLDKYVDLVIRTRLELKELINKTCSNFERRQKAGLC